MDEESHPDHVVDDDTPVNEAESPSTTPDPEVLHDDNDLQATVDGMEDTVGYCC